MQQAIDVWSQLGVLKVEVTPADVIAHGIFDDQQGEARFAPIRIERSRAMTTKHHMVSLAAGICMTAGLMAAAHAEPLRIFYFAWVG